MHYIIQHLYWTCVCPVWISPYWKPFFYQSFQKVVISIYYQIVQFQMVPIVQKF